MSSKRSVHIKKIEITDNTNDIYISDDTINKLNNNINYIDKNEKPANPKNYKSILYYSLIGGGFILIAGISLFVARKIITMGRANDPRNIQMTSLNEIGNLNNINIDEPYDNNKPPLMPIDPSLVNSEVYDEDCDNQINYLEQASTSTSEPRLNFSTSFYDGNRNNNNSNNNNNLHHFNSTPNIPKGILINNGREMNKSINDTRNSSLRINSSNSNEELSNTKKKTNKPRVTFSKGLTTMHEFLSKEWNRAIEYEGLKKETLVDLGWRNGTVVHNFNPNKEDEIKLRIGDSVIIRLAFDDGWAYAFNRNTGVVGMIPIICVKPIKPVKR